MLRSPASSKFPPLLHRPPRVPSPSQASQQGSHAHSCFSSFQESAPGSPPRGEHAWVGPRGKVRPAMAPIQSQPQRGLLRAPTSPAYVSGGSLRIGVAFQAPPGSQASSRGPLLIAKGGSIPLLCLQGVPDLLHAPQMRPVSRGNSRRTVNWRVWDLASDKVAESF